MNPNDASMAATKPSSLQRLFPLVHAYLVGDKAGYYSRYAYRRGQIEYPEYGDILQFGVLIHGGTYGGETLHDAPPPDAEEVIPGLWVAVRGHIYIEVGGNPSATLSEVANTLLARVPRAEAELEQWLKAMTNEDEEET